MRLVSARSNFTRRNFTHLRALDAIGRCGLKQQKRVEMRAAARSWSPPEHEHAPTRESLPLGAADEDFLDADVRRVFRDWNFLPILPAEADAAVLEVLADGVHVL